MEIHLPNPIVVVLYPRESNVDFTNAFRLLSMNLLAHELCNLVKTNYINSLCFNFNESSRVWQLTRFGKRSDLPFQSWQSYEYLIFLYWCFISFANNQAVIALFDSQNNPMKKGIFLWMFIMEKWHWDGKATCPVFTARVKQLGWNLSVWVRRWCLKVHATVSLRKVSVWPSLASGSDLSDSRSRSSLECVDTVLGNERTCQLIFDGSHFLE